MHTGAQTEKKRKAGSRLMNSSAFGSGGKTLNEGAIGEKKETGTGFGKKAGRSVLHLSNGGEFMVV